MKKRIISMAFVLLLVAALLTPVFAEDAEPCVIDGAALLTDAERTELNELARSISDAQSCGVYVVTTSSLEGSSAFDFATRYFTQHGMGRGGAQDGLLFLISVEGGAGNRDFEIIGHGLGTRVLNETNKETLFNSAVSYLSREDYAGACRDFLRSCEKLIPETRRSVTVRLIVGILLALGLGFLLSMIPLAIMKSKLKNLGTKAAAAEYVRKDSLALDICEDRYLRTGVNRVRISTPPAGGGRVSGGGGSSHSGGGFTGVGGKF